MARAKFKKVEVEGAVPNVYIYCRFTAFTCDSNIPKPSICHYLELGVAWAVGLVTTCFASRACRGAVDRVETVSSLESFAFGSFAVSAFHVGDRERVPSM